MGTGILDCAKHNTALDPIHEGFLANDVPTVLFYTSVADKAVAERDCRFRAASPYLLFASRIQRTAISLPWAGSIRRTSRRLGIPVAPGANLVAGKFLEPDSTGQVLLEHGYA